MRADAVPRRRPIAGTAVRPSLTARRTPTPLPTGGTRAHARHHRSAVNTPALKDRAPVAAVPATDCLNCPRAFFSRGRVTAAAAPEPSTDGRFGPSAQKFDGQRVKVTVTVDLSVVDGEFRDRRDRFRHRAAGARRRPCARRSSRPPSWHGSVAGCRTRRCRGRWAMKANSAGSDILISGGKHAP